jgi:hypothetical protein
LRNCRGKPPVALGTLLQDAGLELIVGDRGAFDGAPNQIAVQAAGQIAAIEAKRRFPPIARQMLGADPVCVLAILFEPALAYFAASWSYYPSSVSPNSANIALQKLTPGNLCSYAL